MTVIKRKRNPQDATLRNVRSLRAAILAERKNVGALEVRVKALEAWNVKVWVSELQRREQAIADAVAEAQRREQAIADAACKAGIK